MIIQFLTIPIIIQVICGIHAVKTGRMNWLWIILFFSIVGCLIYFFVEIFPELQPIANKAAASAEKILVPKAQINRLKQALEICDSVDNRSALADAYVQNGQFQESLEILKIYTHGQYADDAHIQAQLALSFYMTKNFAEAKEAILRSRNHNDKFENNNYHLLYAMILAKMDNKELAFAEYTELEKFFIGEEARCRHALLLKETGDIKAAKDLFQSIITKGKQSADFYRQDNQKWFTIAAKELEHQPEV